MPQDFQTILAAHAARYPGMEPQDYAKLAFQSEFGPAHLISDGEDCLAGLRAEWAALPPDPSPAGPEDIGNGLCRLPLSGLAEADLPLTAALFRLTAARPAARRRAVGAVSASAKSAACPSRSTKMCTPSQAPRKLQPSARRRARRSAAAASKSTPRCLRTSTAR